MRSATPVRSAASTEQIGDLRTLDVDDPQPLARREFDDGTALRRDLDSSRGVTCRDRHQGLPGPQSLNEAGLARRKVVDLRPVRGDVVHGRNVVEGHTLVLEQRRALNLPRRR